MGAIASQITSLTIVYSTVYSDADQSKHQSSASMAFVWGIQREPVNSPHKWPVTRKCFHLMTSWYGHSNCLGTSEGTPAICIMVQSKTPHMCLPTHCPILILRTWNQEETYGKVSMIKLKHTETTNENLGYVIGMYDCQGYSTIEYYRIVQVKSIKSTVFNALIINHQTVTLFFSKWMLQLYTEIRHLMIVRDKSLSGHYSWILCHETKLNRNNDFCSAAVCPPHLFGVALTISRRLLTNYIKAKAHCGNL